jgi:hypothetical protein
VANHFAVRCVVPLHQLCHGSADHVLVAYRDEGLPLRGVCRQEDFMGFQRSPLGAQLDVVAPADLPDDRPRPRARAAVHAPKELDVVCVDLQDATAPVRQHPRECVEYGERRDVLFRQTIRVVPQPAQLALGHPLIPGDHDAHLVHRHRVGHLLGQLAPERENQQRPDDALRVLALLLELGEHWHRPAAGALLDRCAVGAEAAPALRADDRIEVLPKQLETEGARQGNVAVRKGVDDEKGVHPGFEKALKVCAARGE